MEMGVSPPMGIRQTPACQIWLPRHELPTTHPHHPTHLTPSCIKHCSFRDYLEISFRFQNTPERGVAFQLATFGHQYTWENGFVWGTRRSECLTKPPLIPSYSPFTMNIQYKLRRNVKGGLVKLSESAFTWSMMVKWRNAQEKHL